MLVDLVPNCCARDFADALTFSSRREARAWRQENPAPDSAVHVNLDGEREDLRVPFPASEARRVPGNGRARVAREGAAAGRDAETWFLGVGDGGMGMAGVIARPNTPAERRGEGGSPTA